MLVVKDIAKLFLFQSKVGIMVVKSHSKVIKVSNHTTTLRQYWVEFRKSTWALSMLSRCAQ